MKKLGVKIELLHNDKGPLWSPLSDRRPEEKTFTDAYLKTLEQHNLKTISGRRGVDLSVLDSLKGKLVTAKQALNLKLIDKIRTFD